MWPQLAKIARTVSNATPLTNFAASMQASVERACALRPRSVACACSARCFSTSLAASSSAFCNRSAAPAPPRRAASPVVAALVAVAAAAAAAASAAARRSRAVASSARAAAGSRRAGGASPRRILPRMTWLPPPTIVPLSWISWPCAAGRRVGCACMQAARLTLQANEAQQSCATCSREAECMCNFVRLSYRASGGRCILWIANRCFAL